MNDTPAPPSADSPSADPPSQATPEPPRREGGLLAWVRAIGFAVVVALVLRLFAFEAYRIPSTSMEDTLLAGDFLFVSKLAYGARLPRLLGGPEARLPGLSSLRRGDIVVFNHPPEPGPVERRTPFIKRVVGLPGDTLQIVGKRVVVNGDTLDAPPLGRHLWRVRYTQPDGVSAETLAALGARVRGGHSTERLVEATADEAQRVAAVDGVAHVERFVRPPQDGSAHF
ncbi:MAG TPA: signal peptidase I, partial [Rhodothermales bacterium]|nr:signal peptidase I [Rhodothermales bacterium]